MNKHAAPPMKLQLLLTFHEDGSVSSIPILSVLDHAEELDRRFRRLIATLTENPTEIGQMTSLSVLRAAASRGAGREKDSTEEDA